MLPRPLVVNVDCAFREDPGYEFERERIEGAGAELRLDPRRTEEGIVEACRGAAVVLLEYAHTPVTARVIEGLEECRALVKYGIGVDNIDLAAAAARGIVVANAAGFCVEEASDHAIALILASARRVCAMDRRIRAGGWFDFVNPAPVRRVRELTLGLLGFGRIAQAVARKLSGFGMKTIAHDPYCAALEGSAVVRVSFEQLIAGSDVLSIHLPATAETRGIIGAAQLAAMKRTAILVNTSRGSAVDQEALLRALGENRIAGAALDVFAQEPLAPGHPLLSLENVVLTPHYAGRSEDSMRDLRRIVSESVEAVLAGFWPPFPVDPNVRPKAPLRPCGEFREGRP